jgi:aspartate/methionine/tyrosine aminotransferase
VIPSLPAELARRLDDIEPFRVMDILGRARAMEAQGRSIIHMEVGEPDFPTPDTIIAAGMTALQQGYTHYTAALGLPELRAAIADYYRTRYGVAVPAGRIAVTPGASGALLLAIASLLNPGDEILLADPGYPCNRHFSRLVEAKAKGVAVGPETGFQLTAELVERHWGPNTRAVLVANPGNPTGTVIPVEELRAIHAVVRRNGGWLLVDEIYHELIYDVDEPSAVALGDDVIVINSFSKYWLMTGWRLGWLIVPDAMMAGVEKLAQNVFLAAPTPSQHAALAAFSTESRQILEMCKAELRRRRDFLLPELERLGFSIPVHPEGAFYIYADISRFSANGEAFARDLLERAGVAITPGVDFGQHAAATHVRLAYTTAMDKIGDAVIRLESVLRDY